ncbi:MAG: isochorismatase family protein [Deltaproteobacteria bacterium]|nr:isochorismatase family protein [Deltaproteobacteria bacterium]
MEAHIDKTIQYLDESTAKLRTRQFLDFLCPLAAPHPVKLQRNPAILILDVQRIFFDPASGAFLPVAPVVLGNIRSLIQAFECRNLPIFFTRHLDEGLGPMAEWWGKGIAAHDWHSQMAIECEKHTVVIKSSYDSFHQTELGRLLKRCGVDQVVVVGVMTHLCVESTVRSAFGFGLSPIIPIDAVGSKNECLHLSALTTLAHGFAQMTDTEEIKHCIEQLA